jgi:hypothetical protein
MPAYSYVDDRRVADALSEDIAAALGAQRAVREEKVMEIKTRLDLDMNSVTKAKVKKFFKDNLEGKDATWPLQGVMLYINGRAKEVISPGFYQEDGVGRLYVGKIPQEARQEYMRPHERLAVIGALINLTGLAEDPDVIEWYTTATGKCLVGVYGQVVKPLVEPKSGQGEVREMAFSNAGIAAKVQGEWVDFKGQRVDVSGSEWTKVEVTV